MDHQEEVPDALRLEHSQIGVRTETTPLSGCHPFGEGGEPAVLWNGMARMSRTTGESDARLVRVEAHWSPDARISWAVDLKDADIDEERAWRPPAEDSQTLVLAEEGEAHRLPVFVRNKGDGWSNGAEFGGSEPLIRVLAHWINLPDFARGTWLVRSSDRYSWLGRTDLRLDGWTLRIDSRPDLRTVYDELKRRRTFAITHVMELRRHSGETFTVDDAKEVLSGLHFALSYALGRRACPALPVGFSPEGHATWTSWSPLNADHPELGAQAWWPKHAIQDLEQYLQVFLAIWQDPNHHDQLRFLTSWATAASDGTYIEPRTTIAISALEHLSWIEEVLSGDLDEESWRKKGPSTQMRRLLQRAHVNLTIDKTLTPDLAEFAAANEIADGPEAIIKVRHLLTHPKDLAGLYNAGSLIAETSRLACRYLDLTLLHWLGYRGHIRDRTRIRGSAALADRVPWV